MTRKSANTPSGDGRRDRAARRARVAKPLEGNRIRVRAKRLDQVDVEKLTLAYWLLAKELVSDQTEGRAESKESVEADDGGEAGDAEVRW